MLDKLLFIQSKIIPVPIEVIQDLVSKATKTDIQFITIKSRVPESQKRERVIPRQISMTLCKNYSGKNLEVIGSKHGGRDHATVLHAVKTINNGIDTRDELILDNYRMSKKEVDSWIKIELEKREEFLFPSQEKTIFNTEK